MTERSIQQGDVFAAACGEKEPRGRVRALGLGPTPQDIGTPGLKCYKPTRLQMEVLARKKVESDSFSRTTHTRIGRGTARGKDSARKKKYGNRLTQRF